MNKKKRVLIKQVGTAICILMQLNLSACFQLKIKTSAKNNIEKLQKLERENHWEELCPLALESSRGATSSFESFRLLGDCYKYGTENFSADLDIAEKYYRKAVLCGSEEGKIKLVDLLKSQGRDIQIPESEYKLDDKLYFGGNRISEECGYFGTLTGPGYLVMMPILIPLAVLAVPVGIILAVTGFSVQFLMIPFK